MNKPPACNRVFKLSYSKHNNTSLVMGACWRNLPGDEYGKRIFSGFVFRGDTRKPELIFREGFIPTGVFEHSTTLEARMERLTGNMDNGFTFSYGVSTSLSSRIAQFYVEHRNPTGHYYQFPSGFGAYTSFYAFDGYIYLIDARDMAGYAINVPEVYKGHPLLMGKRQEFLHEIYEVNFIHAIPNTSVVGAVWLDNFVMNKDCHTSRAWMGRSGFKLSLGENPQYNGDAETVAKLFS